MEFIEALGQTFNQIFIALNLLVFLIFSFIVLYLVLSILRLSKEDRQNKILSEQRRREYFTYSRQRWQRIDEAIWKAAGPNTTETQKAVLVRITNEIFDFRCTWNYWDCGLFEHPSELIKPFLSFVQEAVEKYGVRKEVLLVACHLLLDKFSSTEKADVGTKFFLAEFIRKYEIAG